MNEPRGVERCSCKGSGKIIDHSSFKCSSFNPFRFFVEYLKPVLTVHVFLNGAIRNVYTMFNQLFHCVQSHIRKPLEELDAQQRGRETKTKTRIKFVEGNLHFSQIYACVNNFYSLFQELLRVNIFLS